MELIKITERVYYIRDTTNIGVIKDGNGAILIDTGLDDVTAQQIIDLLAENGLSIKAIINTHSHGDHCGGNAYIQKKTNAEIYASEIEASIIQSPILEPIYFFSGAWPIKDLQIRILNAPPSNVHHIIKPNETNTIDFDNVSVEIVSLPGHSPNQIGIALDGVLFCADTVLPEILLKKYIIPYHIDIGKLKKSLEFLKESKYDIYIPSHADHTNKINVMVEKNVKVIEKIENFIVESLKDRKTLDLLLKEVCDSFGLSVETPRVYLVTKTAIMAYLTALYRDSVVKIEIEDNKMFWVKVD